MDNYIAANETATCTCPGCTGREVARGKKALPALTVIATIAFATRILLRVRRSRI